MRSFLALALIIAGVFSATNMNPDDYKFMRYIVEHNKEYNTIEEFNMRKLNFLFMDAEIAMLNAKVNSTSVHGHNYLSDYTRAEYQKLLGHKDIRLLNRSKKPMLLASNDDGLPDYVDWWDYFENDGWILV